MDCPNCINGIKMCHHRPCFGTPEEFEKIIDAGFAEKLRIDYWIGNGGREPLTQEKVDEVLNPHLKALLQNALDIYKTMPPNPIKDDVPMLSGGTDKDLNFRTDFIPRGRCKLLTEDNKCSLHDLGLKPEQGRLSCCKDDIDLAEDNLYYAQLWDTDKGRQVIEKFKNTLKIN